MKNVVIVESPAKAKTINKYLGSDFSVIASYGHVRDLPSKNGSVKPEEDFEMIWELDDRGQRQMADIAKLVRGANAVYLATDPDREGEAISWHVQQILTEKGLLHNIPVYRIVFHEITKKAIQKALESPRDISQELVDAYLARRALDYLVGFTLSPVLWRKLPGSRSAGRVQSVALRLIVEREIEVEAFKPQEYWTINVFANTIRQAPFKANLTHLNGKKLEKFDVNTEALAKEACASIEARDFTVGEIERKQVKRNPAAPFITSTLQQEASRKLGFGASRTMQIAQKLYEGIDIGGETTGLITYMRTDSIHIAGDAISEIRDHIGTVYGDKYVPEAPRTFKSKIKNAQEAHEAIRPTSVARTPKEMAKYLDITQLKLYELIWKRAVASQMANAIFDQMGINFTSADQKVILRATGSTLVFDGFLRLYQEGEDDKTENEDEENLLPLMNEGEGISKREIVPNQHFTQPPPRFSEASLVKKLEELGIGRPSTYASIINVLQERKYVLLEKKQFLPEERGRLVTTFLTNYFPKYVEYDFTAKLEEELDEISNGQLKWREVLHSFWDDFHKTIRSTDTLTIPDVLERLEKEMEQHLFQGQDRTCPTCKKGIIGLKLSRFGAFLGCNQYPECKYTKPLTTDGEGDAGSLEEPRLIGNDPVTGAAITLRKGPYGFYLQWDGEMAAIEPVTDAESNDTAPKESKAKKTKSSKKPKKPVVPKPKRVSLPAGFAPDQITLDQAMSLKALPISLGNHPESGVPMSVSIGRFGPYVKCGDIFASIPKTDNFLTVTLDRAVEIVAAKIVKMGDKGKSPASKKPTSKAKATTKKRGKKV